MTVPAPPPDNEDERIEALQGLGILDSAPEEAYDDLVQLASQICGTPIALVSLVDVDRQWFKAKVGLGAEETPRDVAFCAHAILGTDVFEVPDATQDPRFRANPLVTGAPDVRFYAGAPLVTPRGHALGTLCVIDRMPGSLDDQQRASLEALGRQVVTQLELRRGLLKLRELGEERERHIVQLHSLERLKDEFVSTVSHELRTPLTSIRGIFGLLSGGVLGDVAPKASNLLTMGVRNTERLIRLINDLLDLERIRQGRLEPDRAAVDTQEFVDAAMEGLHGLASEAGIELVQGARLAAPLTILGERDRLVQVLTNLGSNAIKFSPAGTRVTVSVREVEGRRVRIEVADQGPGIPADKLDALFERFVQLDGTSTRVQQGSGLGLAISRSLTELHGGEIGVESTLGEGSTFWVELPVAG